MTRWTPRTICLGLIYVYMREYDKAIAEGERGVELNPNGDEALAYLGYFLNVAGRPAEAITVPGKSNAPESHAPGLLLRVVGYQLQVDEPE